LDIDPLRHLVAFAEAGKCVYEVPASSADVDAEKADCEARHEQYVLSLVEEELADQPVSAAAPGGMKP
jgi:hypothetical protein